MIGSPSRQLAIDPAQRRLALGLTLKPPRIMCQTVVLELASAGLRTNKGDNVSLVLSAACSLIVARLKGSVAGINHRVHSRLKVRYVRA